jgi:hypothetical protein
MKANLFAHWFSFLTLAAASVIFSSGCATHEEHSFNADFNQVLPTAPKYYVEDRSESSFTITAHQGKPSSGAERIFDVKRAASTIAEAEAKRRGWKNWRLDYIVERNDGWMHFVKAEVVREKELEFKETGSGSQP